MNDNDSKKESHILTSFYLVVTKNALTFIKTTKQNLYPPREAHIFNKGRIWMTNSVNSVGWLLAATEAYSITGKSIEHAVSENTRMITIEKHHWMPILPCIHIVSYPFFLIARGLSDALYPMPRPFSKQTIHKQKKQSGKCS